MYTTPAQSVHNAVFSHSLSWVICNLDLSDPAIKVLLEIQIYPIITHWSWILDISVFSVVDVYSTYLWFIIYHLQLFQIHFYKLTLQWWYNLLWSNFLEELIKKDFFEKYNRKHIVNLKSNLALKSNKGHNLLKNILFS